MEFGPQEARGGSQTDNGTDSDAGQCKEAGHASLEASRRPLRRWVHTAIFSSMIYLLHEIGGTVTCWKWRQRSRSWRLEGRKVGMRSSTWRGEEWASQEKAVGQAAKSLRGTAVSCQEKTQQAQTAALCPTADCITVSTDGPCASSQLASGSKHAGLNSSILSMQTLA